MTEVEEKVKHTPEPWASDKRDPVLFQDVLILDSNGKSIGKVWRSEDTLRIVACVNACAGISTEALEQGVIGALIEGLYQ